MQLYSMTADELTVFANQIKEYIIQDLANKAIITEKQKDLYLQTRAVIVSEKKIRIFGKMWDKLNGIKYDTEGQINVTLVTTG